MISLASTFTIIILRISLTVVSILLLLLSLFYYYCYYYYYHHHIFNKGYWSKMRYRLNWSGWEEEEDGNNGGYILWMRIVWDGVNNSDQIRRPAHVIITIVADLSFYPNVLNYEMMTYSWLFLPVYPSLQLPVLISTFSWLNNNHINVFKNIFVQLICTIFVRKITLFAVFFWS